MSIQKMGVSLYHTNQINIMKAIIDSKVTYKITGERGMYHIAEDNRGKVRMFLKTDVEVIEIDEMPKAKVYKPIKVSKAVAERMNAQYRKEMNEAELRGNFLDCQIESGNYNKNLIR